MVLLAGCGRAVWREVAVCRARCSVRLARLSIPSRLRLVVARGVQGFHSRDASSWAGSCSKKEEEMDFIVGKVPLVD